MLEPHLHERPGDVHDILLHFRDLATVHLLLRGLVAKLLLVVAIDLLRILTILLLRMLATTLQHMIFRGLSTWHSREDKPKPRLGDSGRLLVELCHLPCGSLPAPIPCKEDLC